MSPRRRGRRKSVPASRQRSTRGRKYSRRQEARRPSAIQEAKRKKAGRRNGAAAAKSSTGFVPPPTAETLSWLAKVSHKEQRKAIGAGHRIKVRVDDSESKEVNWRGGLITGVGSNGSKIRIKYNDGRSEVSLFPNKLIVVDEVGNGRHQIRDDVFSVPTANQKPRRTDGVCAAREETTSKMESDKSRRPTRKRKPTWKLRKDTASNDEESPSEQEEEEEEKATRKKNSTRRLRKDVAMNEKDSASEENEKSSRKRKRTRSLRKDAASNDLENTSKEEDDEEETSRKRKHTRKLRKDGGSNDKESSSEEDEEEEEKAMSLKEQRKKVAVGQKVKVRFMQNVDRYGKSSRREKWYPGVISRVFSKGSKVRIDYEDGDSEVSNFPDKDIVLVEASATPTVSVSIVSTDRNVDSDDSDNESFTDSSAKISASEPPKRRTSPRALSEQLTEHQRSTIEKGRKVKVRLPAEYDRFGKMTTENKWHEGVVTRVLSFGSKIGVEYNDGDSDILDFPDENIIVYDEPNAKPEEQTSESRGYQYTSRRRTRPNFFVASPWNDDDTGKEAEVSLRYRKLGARSTARRLSGRGGHVEAEATRKSPPQTQSRDKRPTETEEKQESSSTQLAVEEQRRKIAVGHKVKVAFMTECERHGKPITVRRWYAGTVTKALSGGSKIRIQYKDGTSELREFPSENIVVEVFSAGVEADATRKSAPQTQSRDKGPIETEEKQESSSARLAVEEQRRKIAVGDKVKVAFMTECERHGKPITIRRWYSGTVTKVLSGGSKIRVQYKDGKFDNFDFPNEDIVMELFSAGAEADGTPKSAPQTQSRDKGPIETEEKQESSSTQMAVEEQRKKISVGHKVKVAFVTECERHGKPWTVRRWYSGTVTKVLPGGSKIRIQYKDGKSELRDFPNQDIDAAFSTGAEADATRKSPPQIRSHDKGPVETEEKQAGSEADSIRKSPPQIRSHDKGPVEREEKQESSSTQLAVEEQRKKIAIGHKVKVAFMTECERRGKPITIRRWYSGTVTKVMSGGSKIRIQYKDGKSELRDFPNQDIDAAFSTGAEADATRKSPPQIRSHDKGPVETEEKQAGSEADSIRKSPPQIRSHDKGPVEREEKQESSSTQLAVEEQRKKIAIGHKVKVAFMTECERRGKPITIRRWYSGTVTKVMSGGSKIRIQYKDGKSEISDFPNEDIVVEVFSDGGDRHETPSRRWSCPDYVATNGEDQSAGDELSPTFASRRRYRPDFFFASPRNDASLKAEGQNMSSSGDLSVEEQRKGIAVGQKVKGLFVTKCERHGKTVEIRRWYSGTVTKVMSEGSKIRVQYKDGDTRVYDFPHKDIILQCGISSPWNAKNKQKAAGAPSQSQKTRSLSPSRRWSFPVTSSEKEHNNGANTSLRSQLLKSGSSSRRRTPPDFYFASPWNDDRSETEGKPDSSTGQLPVKEQRKKISVGQKVKGLFVTECQRSGRTVEIRRWYSGIITKVLSGGSKIRIQYKDGDSEVSDFPNENIVVEDETLSTDLSEGYDAATDHHHVESDVESGSMAAEVPSDDDEDAKRETAAASDERGANANETRRKSSGTEEDVDAVSDECGTSAAVDGDEAGESHVQDQQSLFEESRVAASSKQPSEPVPKGSHTVELEEKEAPDQPNQTTHVFVQEGEKDSTSDVSSKESSSSPKEASAGRSDTTKSETKKSTDRDQKSLTEVEAQSVAEGQKVKVRFATMSIRHGKEVKILRWYSAIVTGVLAGGAKIQVQYNDGSSEVLDFPDKDIMVVEEEAPDPVREHEDSKRSNAATVDNKVDNLDESSVPLRKRKHRLSLLGDTSVSAASLPSSPTTSTIPANEKWYNMLEKLKRYKEKYGNALVPQRYKEDKSLGGWVIAQRRAKKLKRLSAEQVEQLEKIGFAWDASFKRGAKRNGHKAEPHSAPEGRVSSSSVATEPAMCNKEPAEETNPETLEEEDTEVTNSFTPEEDETILSIVLGKRTNGSADVEIGKKMRLLANYSPGELYQRALELAQQTPTVGSVGHRVQTALDAKKDDEHVSKGRARI